MPLFLNPLLLISIAPFWLLWLQARFHQSLSFCLWYPMLFHSWNVLRISRPSLLSIIAVWISSLFCLSFMTWTMFYHSCRFSNSCQSFSLCLHDFSLVLQDNWYILNFLFLDLLISTLYHYCFIYFFTNFSHTPNRTFLFIWPEISQGLFSFHYYFFYSIQCCCLII
jgi:hypothetical protein